MQIIKTEAKELEYAPFREAAAKWFLVREEGGLPTVNNLLEGADRLEGFRITSGIGLSPLTIRYREVGKNIEALYGKPMAGKTIDDLYNDWFRKRAYEGYKKAIDQRFPVYIRRVVSTVALNVGYHQIYLPCGREQVTEMVSYLVPTDANIQTRADWEKAVKDTPWI